MYPLVASVALALAFSGCGGSPPAHSAKDAQATVLRWVSSFKNADGATYCGLMADDRLAVEQRTVRQQFGSEVSCEQAWSAHPPNTLASDKADLAELRRSLFHNLTVRGVKVDGDQATVRLSSTAESRETKRQIDDSIALVWQHGGWRVACTPQACPAT